MTAKTAAKYEGHQATLHLTGGRQVSGRLETGKSNIRVHTRGGVQVVDLEAVRRVESHEEVPEVDETPPEE